MKNSSLLFVMLSCFFALSTGSASAEDCGEDGDKLRYYAMVSSVDCYNTNSDISCGLAMVFEAFLEDYDCDDLT